MPVDEDDATAAETRRSILLDAGYVLAVHGDRRQRSPSATLNTGVRLVMPVRLSRGSADAPPRVGGEGGIGPSGLGLHGPSIDADVCGSGLPGGMSAPPPVGTAGRRSA